MTPADTAVLLLDALRAGETAVEIVVLEGPRAGARMLLVGEETSGSLGEPALDAAATDAARAAIAGGSPRTVELAATPSTTVRVFIEPHRPADDLVIVGAGHIARPLARVGASLGFSVTVLDDRPGFATRERFPDADRVVQADFSDPFSATPLTPRTHLVLVTRGHKYDYEVLRRVVVADMEPAYVGMVGSRRRVRAAFEQLVRDGVPVERLNAIHAPIGLDIGAETPAEIAISIGAELVLARRGGTGAPLRDRDRVVTRWIHEVD